MHTVATTSHFLNSAGKAGLTNAEVEAIETFVAENPQAGVEIAGTGGFRKFRFAGRGKGKSGGYRVVTFFSGRDIPVFLIDVFSKGTKENLSQAAP